MKKFGILIFVIALILGIVVTNMFSFGDSASSLFKFNFGWKGVKGSGNVITDQRDVSGFHAIDVGGVYQVEVTIQKEFSVVVEADDNLVPLIRTEVSGGVLKIESDRRISPKSTMLIKVGMPDLDDLDVSGVANVHVVGLKNDSLALHSSGASKISVTGETSKLTVDVSGATKIDAGNLTAVNAKVEATGASNVSVNVSGELRADASGASHVTYSGSPKNVIKDTSGAGNISAR